MFRDRGEIRRRLMEIVQRFREKGATSPEKAMTIQELGLPPRFEQAMHRRLGQLGIFVEANGKYYLDEERLRQVQEQRRMAGGSSSDGAWNRSVNTGWSRYAGILLMLPIGLIAALILFYILVFSGVGVFPGEFLIVLVVILVLVAVARILFWRSRRAFYREQWGSSVGPAR